MCQPRIGGFIIELDTDTACGFDLFWGGISEWANQLTDRFTSWDLRLLLKNSLKGWNHKIKSLTETLHSSHTRLEDYIHAFISLSFSFLHEKFCVKIGNTILSSTATVSEDVNHTMNILSKQPLQCLQVIKLSLVAPIKSLFHKLSDNRKQQEIWRASIPPQM